ncbi:MAG: hypothetical protein WD738_12400 [Pirellulales bacterium]
MGKYFKSMQFKHYESTIVVHFDAAQLCHKPEELQVFLDEFADECRRWLLMHLACGPTYREYMSMRIKHGIKAAKERRQQPQQQ